MMSLIGRMLKGPSLFPRTYNSRYYNKLNPPEKKYYIKVKKRSKYLHLSVTSHYCQSHSPSVTLCHKNAHPLPLKCVTSFMNELQVSMMLNTSLYEYVITILCLVRPKINQTKVVIKSSCELHQLFLFGEEFIVYCLGAWAH